MTDQSPFSISGRQAAQRILAIGKMKPRAVHSAYGRELRGVVDLVFDATGKCRFWPDLIPVQDNFGMVIGFTFPGEKGRIDLKYDDASGTITPGGYAIYQGSNQNLARRASKSAEERLAKYLRSPNSTWFRECEALGVTGRDATVTMAAASRLAMGLINEALHNAIPARQAGALTVLRTIPPTTRGKFASAIFGEHGDQVRDLLAQAPIAATLPGAVIRNAGKSPKKFLPTLGLPKSSRSIQPGAIAPIVHWMRVADRDADLLLDLGWITEDLCKRLPLQMGLQRALIDVLCRLAIREVPAAEVERFGIWACSGGLSDLMMGDLAEATRRILLEYYWAPKDLLDDLGIAEGNWDRNLPNAIEAAREFQEKAIDAEGGSLIPYTPPTWTLEDGEIPGTRWQMARIKTEAELRREGKQARHCVASYHDYCLYGSSVIYTIRRRSRSNDRKSHVFGDEYLGATLELIHRHGRVQIGEIKAPGSQPVSQSIRKSIEKLIKGE